MTNRLKTGIRFLIMVIVFTVFGSILPPRAVYAQTAQPIITSVAWSPDGTRIAAGYSQGEVKIWDAATLSLQTSIQTGEEEWASVVSAYIVGTLSWSPDGHLLAAGLGTWPPGGFVQVIDVDTGQVLESLFVGYGLSTVAWSPDGSRLAAGLTLSVPGGTEGWVRVWDSRDFQVVAELRHGRSSDVSDIAWSPDGSKLASAGYHEYDLDNSVRTWDTTQWAQLQTFEHPDAVFSVTWSPDGTRLASAGADVLGRIWDAVTGQQLVDLQIDDPEVQWASYIAWRPNSSQVVSRVIGRIFLWDSATGEVIEERPLVFDSLNLVWNPAGSLLALGLDDRIVLITPGSGSGTPSVRDPAVAQGVSPARASALAWNPAGTELAVGYSDGFLDILDATTRQLVMASQVFNGPIGDAEWSPDSSKIAISCFSEIKVIHAANGQELMSVAGRDIDQVYDLAWSPDGNRLADAFQYGMGTITAEYRVRIWDISTGKMRFIVSLQGQHTDVIGSVAWSPDGNKIATASVDGTAIIWDMATQSPLLTLQKHTHIVEKVTWSPDGTQLITVGTPIDMDNAVRLWDSETGQSLAVFSCVSVSDAAWSPDGNMIAIADGNSVRIMDVATQTQVDFYQDVDYVYTVAWSPDGTRLAYGGEDGTLKIVPIPEIVSGTPSAPRQ